MDVQLKKIIAGLLFFLLHGCTLAPDYQRPDLPVAEQVPAALGNQKSLLPAKDADGGQC